MGYIPRPGFDPLPVTEVTAGISYFLFSRYQHVEHCSASKFRDLHLVVEWKHVWASLRLWCFLRSVQDTLWLSFHGILPTADCLVRFGMRVNPACFCGQPETLLHLFTACPFAPQTFDWLILQQRKLQPSACVISPTICLFGFPSASPVPVVFTALLQIFKSSYLVGT